MVGTSTGTPIGTVRSLWDGFHTHRFRCLRQPTVEGQHLNSTDADRCGQATPGKPRNTYRQPKMGTAFVHTVLDDHSRVAYAEIHDDESAATAITVLRHATAWFTTRGIRIERVLSDNGPAYRSHAWRQACHQLGITPKRTRPYRPQTNGKSRGSTASWPTAGPSNRMFTSESHRRKALPGWLHHYNHHRPHTAIGRNTPISRLTNLPGHHTYVSILNGVGTTAAAK